MTVTELAGRNLVDGIRGDDTIAELDRTGPSILAIDREAGV